MPRSSGQPVERTIADAAAFDLSETDEGDTGDTAVGAFATCEPQCATLDRARVHRPDDVLAICALLLFQDRRRKTRRGNVRFALPGL